MQKIGDESRKQQSLLKLNRIVCYILLIILTIMCIFPFYILIINSTRAHPDISKGFSILPGKSFLVNLKNLFADGNLPALKALWNSTFISMCVAALTTYFSTMTAFGIHAYRFKFRRTAFCIIMLIMMVPTQVSALGFIQLITKMKMMDTFYPLIIPSIASPVVFFFMIQYMESSLPIEIVEAARIDGASEFRTFNSMVIPIMKPAMAVQAIFTFVSAWNNYFIPTLILNSSKNKTIPIIMGQLRSADFLKFDLGKVYMMISVGIIPVVIVYILLSKFIVRGVALGSVKG